MTNLFSSANEERRFWQIFAQRVAAVDWVPPMTRDEADDLLTNLPHRAPEESLGDWLARLREPAQTARVIPFRLSPQVRVRVIDSIFVKAAARTAPKLPQQLVCERFRMTFKQSEDQIAVFLQMQGREYLTLGGAVVHVAGPGGREQVLATVKLSAEAEGRFTLQDTEEVRAWLTQVMVLEDLGTADDASE